MIDCWLNLPPAGLFGVLALFYGATMAAIALLVFAKRARPFIKRIDGVVPGYFTAVSVLFALLTGFLASDIGDRNRQAARAVQMEAAELHNIFTLSVASASDMRAIRTAWHAYVTKVVKEDFPAMARGEKEASAAGLAYDDLLREVSDPKIAGLAGSAVHSALLNAAVRVGTARSDRVALASDRTNDLKWIMVLILGVLAQISIGMVHVQKRGPHLAALSVFSITVVVALGFMALQESPFEGPIQVSAAPFEDLVKLIGPN
jgi:hypothetical protein